MTEKTITTDTNDRYGAPRIDQAPSAAAHIKHSGEGHNAEPAHAMSSGEGHATEPAHAVSSGTDHAAEPAHAMSSGVYEATESAHAVNSGEGHTSEFVHNISPGKDRAADAESRTPARHIPTVGEEIRTLILKIVYVLAAFFIIFTFIFGLHRNLSVGMQPSLRDGDLLFYYRLDKDYRANNIVLFKYKDDLIASRVIAVPGDTVNISDKGLEINGHVMFEPEIYSKTTQFKDGPTFPLEVEEGTVFVLGDNREKANDSRIIGLIDDKDIQGKVMGVIRRRNL